MFYKSNIAWGPNFQKQSVKNIAGIETGNRNLMFCPECNNWLLLLNKIGFLFVGNRAPDVSLRFLYRCSIFRKLMDMRTPPLY